MDEHVGQGGHAPLPGPGMAPDLLQGDPLLWANPEHAGDDGLTGRGGLVGGGVGALAYGFRQLQLHTLPNLIYGHLLPASIFATCFHFQCT
jgi:hypothetical protein